MGLDEELESMEEVGETDAEWTDQETELEDAEDDEDALFDADEEDAAESDLEHAYDSFMTDNEADYDGWDPDEVPEAIQAEEDADILHSEGYHIEEEPEEESEVIEMEIEDGDVYAVIVDEHDNEIGFILLDEDGNEQEYYYVAEDNDGDGVRVETLSNRRLEQSYQIVNIADACNECGNCATFCPSAGAPYRDKPRIHLSRESFDNAPDGYRLASPSRLEGKRGGKAFSLAAEKDGFVFESDALIAHLDGGTLCATKVTLNGDVNEAALSGAVEAATLFRLLARKQPFAGPKHK